MPRSNEYHAEYEKARYHRLRARAIESLGGRCVHCGVTEGLEFDHIDPATKQFPVSRFWSVSKERRDVELAKCQLLCNPCHKEKTMSEVVTVEHGGGKTGKHGCRCDPCRLKKNDYLKHLKRERRARGLKD